MTDAYIYDHVRSPRGKGRPSGSLHEVTPIELSAQVLGALRDRSELDTSEVDDVVFGCVSPVGDQGANVARVSALVAGYGRAGSRQAAQPVLRIGSRGDQHGGRSGHVRPV